MKVLKKLVLDDFVELTDRQKKKILGGNTSVCESASTSSCSNNPCPDRYYQNPDGSYTTVKQSCKVATYGSSSVKCACS